MKVGFFLRTALLVGVLGCWADVMAVAEEPVSTPTVVGRVLTGGGNLGDVGRFVGPVSLGTVTVSSAELGLDEEAPGVTAPNVTIRDNGFAWTSSGLLLRNGSGSDLVFSGNQAQSHELDVYFFGAGGVGPIDRNGAPFAFGDFSVQEFSLTGAGQSDQVNQRFDQVTDENGDQTNTVIQTYGGFWRETAVFNNSLGEEVSRSFTSGRNPFDSDGIVRRSSGIDDFNRTSSPQPAPPATERRPVFAPPFFLDEEASEPAQRIDALFEVDPTSTDDSVELDLSGVEISVSGQSIVDRVISSGVVNLGRSIRSDTTEAVSRTDSVVLRTSGSDAERTRLDLSSFSFGAESNGVSASFGGEGEVARFDSGDSTATVDLTANFEIDRNEIGTFRIGHDAGDNISSPEELNGQRNQSSLTVGYQYAVVDNNTVESDDLTVFRIGDFDTSGASVENSVRLVNSTDTHTRLGFSRSVELDNTLLQSVTLNGENGGITAEGLDDEEVIAATTFNVHTRQIASSQLETNEGSIGEDEVITINNAGEATGLDATAFFVGVQRSGSNRWFFPVEGSLDLEVGESVDLTATFDTTGLPDEVGEGGLGRNFRTQFTLEFQDGRDIEDEDLVEGTVLARGLESTSRFDIFGSAQTRQQFNYVVERAVEAEAASGFLTLASGVSLRDEGINLTNTLENTSEGFGQTQTTLEILDGTVGAGGLGIAVDFQSLALASEGELVQFTEAAGFETLASDIAQVTGLDGVLHTLQLNFDFTDELDLADAGLLWLDEGLSEEETDNAWVNAILGNSDIDSYDLAENLVTLVGSEEAISLSEFLESRQFELSYTDYLLSVEGGVPELGAFGFDESNGFVWAVIDHNSFFASTATAVPEPSSLILLSSLAMGFCIRRRR